MATVHITCPRNLTMPSNPMLEDGAIALDPAVPALPGHISDGLLRTAARIPFADDLGVAASFVRDDREGRQRRAFSRAPRGNALAALAFRCAFKTEVDEPSVPIEGAPRVVPPAVHAEVRLVHTPGRIPPDSMPPVRPIPGAVVEAKDKTRILDHY